MLQDAFDHLFRRALLQSLWPHPLPSLSPVDSLSGAPVASSDPRPAVSPLATPASAALVLSPHAGYIAMPRTNGLFFRASSHLCAPLDQASYVFLLTVAVLRVPHTDTRVELSFSLCPYPTDVCRLLVRESYQACIFCSRGLQRGGIFWFLFFSSMHATR
ncbi:hypothetical protein BU14_0311s0002 [Porphyra umbilicalis]|uniref:Uncharacterized protein n=1 Tax=Porphyra umbilicalis TaxID=2786 RepID=A0A1X6NZN6_PORUM|nr:hypothetical protein BU14_0311s0002 [Porphyra umbilicalis]|eukprot:OSX74062.1 hypothetical protein BU14_0311s0002 [Porphyra umbilicalis]